MSHQNSCVNGGTCLSVTSGQLAWGSVIAFCNLVIVVCHYSVADLYYCFGARDIVSLVCFIALSQGNGY